MRVNHVGEVCAQALYTSQALGARVFSNNPALARHLEAAGVEETDHLAWTSDRLRALNSRPSLLNPVWYAGAFALGLVASRMGRLPATDAESLAVVAHMRDDEARHASEALQAGAAELPLPAKLAMKAAAKVMTTVAHRI
jgi:ubiquinone biosynthesis monooxygenase Coq7